MAAFKCALRPKGQQYAPLCDTLIAAMKRLEESGMPTLKQLKAICYGPSVKQMLQHIIY